MQWLYPPGGARLFLLDVVPLQTQVPSTNIYSTFLPLLDKQDGGAFQSSRAAIARASHPPEEGYRQADSCYYREPDYATRAADEQQRISITSQSLSIVCG